MTAWRQLPLRSPIWLVFCSMASIQSGSALAKHLFVYVNPLGMASLRLGLAAVVMLGLTRPVWRQYSRRDYRLVVVFGLSMGAMNALLYSAIARIPLGVAVTLEFIGPLGVALAHSRRALDVVWVVLAATGVALLTPLQTSALDPVGVLLALLAGGCWASYIVLSARTGLVFKGSDGVAMGMAAGAIAMLPLGLATEGMHLLSPSALGLGLGVALLASAIPYSLEMAALRRLPVRVFGVLMSLEPAVAATMGLLILGETLNLRMGIAIALVTVAAAGSTYRKPTP